MNSRESGWLVTLMLTAAILLSLLPLPAVMAPFEPYWVALVVIYWALETEDSIGMGTAFLTGIVLDVLGGSSALVENCLFVGSVHDRHELIDRLDRHLLRRHLDAHRLEEDLVGKRLHLARHGGREEQRLPVFRQQPQHPPDVPDEAHVQKAVGLVEH